MNSPSFFDADEQTFTWHRPGRPSAKSGLAPWTAAHEFRSMDAERKSESQCLGVPRVHLTGAYEMKTALVRITLLFIILAVGARAQTNQGSIAGTVFDPSGAVVGGAKVTAVSSETGARYEVLSSDAGSYTFPHLNIGVYDVTVSAAGFKVATLKGVVVEIGTTSSLDVKLVTGASSETITVDADTPRIQTESSEIGTVVG